MRYDLVNKFKKDIDNGKLDELLRDNYELDYKNNKYFKVLQDGTLIELKNEDDMELEEWIKERDLFSNVVSTQKCIDKLKKTLSNTYLTLFIKVENIKKMDTNYISEFYFEKIKNYKYDRYTKPISDKFENINEDLFNLCSEKLIKTYEELKKVYEQDKTIKDSVKLKLFFDTDIENYNKEINKYLYCNLFLSNEYCKEVDGKIYGVPNLDITLNKDKPFLRNLSMPNTIPFLVDIESNMNMYKINLLLKFIHKNINDNSDKYVNSTFYFDNDSSLENLYNILEIKNREDNISLNRIKFENGKSFSITDEEVILPFDSENSYIDIYNYMNIKNFKTGEILPDEKMAYSRFYYYLFDFIDANDKHINEQKLKTYNFKIVKSFCYDGKEQGFKNYYKKLFSYILIDLYKNLSKNKNGVTKFEYIDNTLTLLLDNYVKKLINLKMSIDKKFNILEEDLLNREEYSKQIAEKVDKNMELESTDEFLFLYGQVYRFLVNFSKASSLKMDLLNIPLRLTNSTRLIEELKRIYEKYSYTIYINKKLSNALSMLFAYSNDLDDKKIKDNLNLYIGLHYDNLFYSKDKKKEEDEKNEGNEE